MTDLTEQWKKGELLLGWYYIKAIDRFTFPFGIAFIDGKEITMPLPHLSNDEIEQILAPVPTYEEYLALQYDTIDKLKELLKECSPYISRSVTSRMIKNSAGYKKDAKLLAKINQVLGEDK